MKYRIQNFEFILTLFIGLSEKEDQAQEMALAKETEARQLLQEQLREQQEQNRQESDKFLRQIDELRETLAANERTSARMEERMQREREDLMAKLQESEARHEVQTFFFFREFQNFKI